MEDSTKVPTFSKTTLGSRENLHSSDGAGEREEVRRGTRRPWDRTEGESEAAQTDFYTAALRTALPGSRVSATKKQEWAREIKLRGPSGKRAEAVLGSGRPGGFPSLPGAHGGSHSLQKIWGFSLFLGFRQITRIYCGICLLSLIPAGALIP